MNHHLDGLDNSERVACTIAERVLGVVAQAWDVDGRQGAVDAMLIYPDDRRAAFEVTSIAAQGARQNESLLSRDNFAWPLPGNWWWSAEVGSVRELPRLRNSFSKIAMLCESVGAVRPEQLSRLGVAGDPDVDWLVDESSSSMRGHPEVPARDGELIRHAKVVPPGRGGAVDEDLTGLSQALDDEFATSLIQRKFEKLLRTPADERHLFIAIHYTALPFPVFDGLAVGEVCPPDPPPLPAGITHLWLAPQVGRRVLLWSPSGWQQAYPYDN